MRRKIIPNDYSINIFNNMQEFCDISLENYFLVKKYYEKLKHCKNFDEYEYSDSCKMRRSIMISALFSQMCIESMLNEYVIQYFEKSFIEDVFEKLEIKKKFVFISKVILHKNFDKSRKLYNCINKLVKYRNELVHDKSDIVKEDELYNVDYNWDDFLIGIKEDFDISKNSIISIIETAKFLESSRCCNFYIEKLFLENWIDNSTTVRSKAVKEFNIKMDID